MKRFKEAVEKVYDTSREEKLAHDMALISEAGKDICLVPLEKLRSKVIRDRHKKMCVTPKKVNTKSIWSKAAQKAAGGRHKLYNSLEEGPADNLVVLIRDITSQMIGAIKKNDQKKLIGLYKNLGKVIK